MSGYSRTAEKINTKLPLKDAKRGNLEHSGEGYKTDRKGLERWRAVFHKNATYTHTVPNYKSTSPSNIQI